MTTRDRPGRCHRPPSRPRAGDGRTRAEARATGTAAPFRDVLGRIRRAVSFADEASRPAGRAPSVFRRQGAARAGAVLVLSMAWGLPAEARTLQREDMEKVSAIRADFAAVMMDLGESLRAQG